MRTAATLVGILLALILLWDAFETIVLPRRVSRKLRFTRLFYRYTWPCWRWACSCLAQPMRRERFLSFYGPLSLLLLLATWAFGLIVAFAFLHWAAAPTDAASSFGREFYMSGTTFFTLGLGDVVPRSTLGQATAVIESGVGFGFLALVIGYLPVIYQAFSRREVRISLLDARAGSPPTAAELLRRHATDQGLEALGVLLFEWETWSAELLESHLSYPVLAYFRSQHSSQSWLSALTTILDTSAFLLCQRSGQWQRQAELTFAMARHAVVDLAQVFAAVPNWAAPDRLPREAFAELRRFLAPTAFAIGIDDDAESHLAEIRRLYEPYVDSLARHLALPLSPWFANTPTKDNWRTSAFEPPSSFQIRAAQTNPTTERSAAHQFPEPSGRGERSQDEHF